MKLKTYIFRWVLFASLIPVSALGLFSTYYLETLYNQSVHHEGQQVLEKLSLELSASLNADRKLVKNLTQNPAFQRYFGVLNSALKQQIHPESEALSQDLANVFVQIQSVFSHFTAFRILDRQGNALLKVKNGQISQPLYESFDSYPLVEPENVSPDFLKQLSDLHEDHVSFAHLMQFSQDSQNTEIPLQDATLALYKNNLLLGYLLVTISSKRHNRLLSIANLFPGQLFITQIDSTNPEVHGRIVYLDKKTAANEHTIFPREIEYLQKLDSGQLWEAVNLNNYGYVKSRNYAGLYHFIEYFPNPESLSSWVIASYTDNNTFQGPLRHIRSGLWALLGVAILSALFLANTVSRYISHPIKKLTKSFHLYAEGKKPEKTFSSLHEIKQLAISFDSMAEILDAARWDRHHAEQRMIHSAKMASIGQMAAGIGHELNNPLNNMLSLNKLIQRELEQALSINKSGGDASANLEIISHDLDSIHEEIERSSRIIRGILNFARQLPDKHIEIINIDNLVISCVDLVNREAKQKQVILKINSPQQIAQFTSGDLTKLQQAIINILQNAVFVSQQNQFIDIHIVYSYEYAQILIRDYGTGFDEGIREKLFDPFFTTKEIGQGTGLGLAIALGIIESHGGQLYLENVENDKGAQVTIYLPLVEPE